MVLRHRSRNVTNTNSIAQLLLYVPLPILICFMKILTTQKLCLYLLVYYSLLQFELQQGRSLLHLHSIPSMWHTVGKQQSF